MAPPMRMSPRVPVTVLAWLLPRMARAFCAKFRSIPAPVFPEEPVQLSTARVQPTLICDELPTETQPSEHPVKSTPETCADVLMRPRPPMQRVGGLVGVRPPPTCKSTIEGLPDGIPQLRRLARTDRYDPRERTVPVLTLWNRDCAEMAAAWVAAKAKRTRKSTISNV